MKNTKNIFRIVFCVVLILTMMLSMASCDIKGAFQSLGEGDFKGAWNSMIGKKDPNVHEHSYSAVLTAPDCDSEGYTTYTCECGESYIGDKVPALGHDYEEKVTRFPTPYTEGVISKMCTVCGVHTDTYINTVTFTLPEVSDFIKSLVGTNSFVLSAKDSEITLVKEIETDSDVSYDKDFLAINLGYIEINGEGEELYAYFNCELGVASYTGPDENATPNFDSQTTITVIVDGEDVSIAITEDGDSGEEDYELSKLFYGAIASSLGMSYEQFEELVYVGGKANACMPFVQTIISTIATLGSDNIDPILPAILSFIDEEVIVKEGNKYSIDFTGLANLIASLGDKTLVEIVDERYGKGTFDRVEKFIVSLPTMKVRDVADLAIEISERSEVSLDDIYSLVNCYIYTMSGEDFNIESEMITRYDMTVIGVLLESSDYTEEEIAEKINEMTLNIKNVFDTVSDLDIDQLYNYMAYGDANYSISGNGEIFRITDQLSSMIEAYDEMITAEITVDDNGAVEFIHLHIEHVIYLSVGTDASGDNFVLELYEEVDDGYIYYVINFNSNANDVTFTYWVGSHKIIDIRAIKNESGEIISASGLINQVVSVSTEVIDSTGTGYIEVTEEKTEKVADLTYTNNGDGTYTILIEENDGKQEIEINVTETEDSLTVTGSINAEYYENGVTVGKNEGSFSYIAVGESVEFNLTVDEITYDYTESSTEEGESERAYDFENPKTYDVIDVVFTNDGNGNLSLSVDTNNVSHDNGVSDVKNATDVIATVTTSDDKIVIDVESGDVGVKITVAYTKTDINVGAGVSEGDVLEPSYIYSVDGIKFELYKGDELSLLVEAEAIEIENGVNFKFNIEGLEYTYYD